MKQALHIFLKDARRFWPEILLSLLVLSIYVSIQPSLWTGHVDLRTQALGTLSGILAVLVPVGWWVLVSRVILAEKLVGDTQFWITRPYEWRRLLAAKALFLAVFLAVPFFLAQMLLLTLAGFDPHAHAGGLLFVVMYVSGVIVLPLVALATVTSSFARVTLILFGILLAFVVFITVSSLALMIGVSVPSSNQNSHTGVFSLWTVALLSIIVLQYALRRVWLARAILLTLPVLICGLMWVDGKLDQSRFDKSYPIVQNGAPLEITYDPNPGSHGTEGMQASSTTVISPSIQLKESGITNGSTLLFEGDRAGFTAPDGFHWDSGWQAGMGDFKLNGEVSDFSPNVLVPLAVAEKYQATPVSIHLSLAFTEVRPDKTSTVALPNQAFPVPDLGVCFPQTGWAADFGHITGIGCIAPLRNPQLTYASTYWSDENCKGTPTTPDQGVLGSGWQGSVDRGPGEFGISPVKDLPLQLSNNMNNNKNRYLCPGTPITFTQYSVVRRLQVAIDIKTYTMPQVSINGNQITVTQ